MARIVYALTDQGRGHTSRVWAIADQLERRGHELLMVCGGQARKTMLDAGRRVVEVPVARHMMRNNRIVLWPSLFMALGQLSHRGAVENVEKAIRDFDADLLISDFESYSLRAAKRIGLPVLTLNHQQVLTRTRYSVPLGHRWDAFVARLVVSSVTPRDSHALVTSFFFPEVRDPSNTTLVGPILRREVLDARAVSGDEVLVYHNDPNGFEGFLDELASVDAKFVVYNFGEHHDAERYPNIRFAAPSRTGFLRDLERCKAVICSAGYTLICESLYLKKPMLTMPNLGIFEQGLNAIMLAESGLGACVPTGRPSAEDVRQFLQDVPTYRERLQAHVLPLGNEEAVHCIEQEVGRALALGRSLQPEAA